MPARPKERIAEFDRKMELALSDLKTDKYKFRREAVRIYEINPSTFNARANDGQSIAETHQSHQLFIPTQEDALTTHIK